MTAPILCLQIPHLIWAKIMALVRASERLNCSDYLAWSKQWLKESIRVLKPGGSLFIFNLPKWCIEYGAYLNQEGMNFRHWIACRMPTKRSHQ
jgi:DNA modification methylase